MNIVVIYRNGMIKKFQFLYFNVITHPFFNVSRSVPGFPRPNKKRTCFFWVRLDNLFFCNYLGVYPKLLPLNRKDFY